MSMARVQGMARPNVRSIRRGNRRTETSYWAQGGRFFLAFTASLVFVVFALGIVWTNHQIVQTAYSIAELNREMNRLMDDNRELKLELANLTALDKLEDLAASELGLVHPAPEQMVVIE